MSTIPDPPLAADFEQWTLPHSAFFYSVTGWPIFPVRCTEKAAHIKGWPTRATRNHDVITRWWERWPDAGIGLPTGQRSRLFALDIDGEEGERSLEELQARHGVLPDNCPAQISGSGKGRHLLFQWPRDREITNSAGTIAPKIDVRGKGGMIVLAPSLHQSGGRYRWQREPWIYRPPPPAPTWLLDLIAPPANDHARIPEGRRDDTLFRRLLREVKACDDFDSLLDVARSINMDCIPPLPDGQVVAKAKHVWNWERSGKNLVGGRGATILSHAVMEQLARYPDAFALYATLLRQHDRGTAFPVAKSRAAALGWTLPRFKAARTRLIEQNVLECVSPGGRGPNDPPIFRWCRGA